MWLGQLLEGNHLGNSQLCCTARSELVGLQLWSGRSLGKITSTNGLICDCILSAWQSNWPLHEKHHLFTPISGVEVVMDVREMVICAF